METRERFPRELEVLRQMADELPQIVWVARPDGAHEYYNRKWQEFTGLPVEQSDDAAWTALFHPDDAEQADRLWREALEKGSAYEVEFRLKRASDGVYRWFLGRALPCRDAAGNIVKWFGTCTDIHEQKLTEGRLRSARDAVKRESQRKDDFLGMVSHELRTPLNAVFGWTRLMQENLLSEQERTQAVESIMRNAETQRRLIEDVLDITRIVNQKLALDRHIVNVADLVNEALDTVRSSAEAKRVTLTSSYRYNDLLVYGDPMRLEQITLNLLTNGVKFTPEGGEIHVEVTRVEGRAAVIVSDTGQGISPDLLPHIFERFRQGDSSSTRRHGGLGLGLTIAHQLVSLHGGELLVDSSGENQGSRFTVLLPIVAVGALPSAQGDAIRLFGEHEFPAESLRGVHVMAIDDEASVRELLALALAKCGASVTIASSVEDALNLLPNLSPDVVVSDIAMPGADGYDFLQRLRAKTGPNAPRVPVIALTAYASLQDRNRALEAGFDSHLTKPVDPAELVRTIAATQAKR